MKSICILIPCYNEEGNPSLINKKLQSIFTKDKLNKYRCTILFVNDGSADNTLSEIKKISDKYENVYYISLSRNFGHQNAIKAGIDHAEADAVITMDADLQHPPELITDIIKYWEDGYDVVNTKRIDEGKGGIFKRITSSFFYKIINRLSYVKIESGAADFRLLDSKVINELQKINEQNLFLRGIIPWLGFRQCSIKYQPDKRKIGKTKYSVKKMFSFAISGITSFSIKPLRLSMLIGLALSILAIVYMLYAIYINLFTAKAMPGWTSIIVSVLFIGGLQLLMLGIIGEYLGKLFIENKKRPNYIIEEKKLRNEN
ncbi:MAG: glycosyltransferase family 2 protein [Bacteroidales bacterium]|nr:glycosyltransferase family 2 protein [Bacteroidales bacterium]MCF8343027.1 glycosyltransferase family 2 protein [Bacteroidales bacterium]MCF8350267.1 glycosyltransferase family 2 protein [Bacteroidales bacterium]MCF8375999.1 glycosyltransferase family 2 protein [Bacteroidales bacterium]MCF8400487.1 glycosyltransferase family 2 protein [Bacteroidales bacterium]